MNKIQQLIDELQSRKSEADKMDELNTKCGHYGIAVCYQQRSKAYDFCIQELTLLLSDKHTEAITGAAHVANTLSGEVCPHCGKPLTAESSGADSSETGDVRQNLGQLKDGGTTDG